MDSNGHGHSKRIIQTAPLLQRLPSSMSGDHRFHRYQRSPSLLSRDAAFIAIGHKLVPEPFDLDGAGGV